ncbi:MAG: rod shape-determining protein MreC [Candidatus Omnitrophica bacterium]|nr:rod shape-determining protein MreC [Candidatus Omnitrophota bacterium]
MFVIKKRALLIALLVIIVLVLNPSILSTAKRVTIEIIAFPVKVIENIKGACITRGRYLKDNKSLRKENNRLKLELNRVLVVRQENDRLRELLAFKKRTPLKTIPAEVIGRVPSTWNNILLINKGEAHRVRRHMAVCTAEGLIGTVIETGPLTSKVMLLTDPNSRLGVMLVSSRQTGVLEGGDDGVLKVIYLGMDSEIKFNERVVTAGVGGPVPAGIPVGTVQKIGRSLVGLYKYAVIKPCQDTNSVEEVLCIE